ncbi:MAG: hypothetical protein ACPGYK_07590 [Flavobacteriales bacterium]
MPQNPLQIRAAVHSLFNHVVEECFEFMLRHPEYESEAQTIIAESSLAIRDLATQIDNCLRQGDSLSARNQEAILQHIAEAAQEQSLSLLRMLQGLQNLVGIHPMG